MNNPDTTVGELVERLRARRRLSEADVGPLSCDTLVLINPDGPEAAELISSLQKEIDALRETLRAARVIIVEDAKACRAFRHESEEPSGPENVLAKIDAALSNTGGHNG